jgi:hypothetical protein
MRLQKNYRHMLSITKKIILIFSLPSEGLRLVLILFAGKATQLPGLAAGAAHTRTTDVTISQVVVLVHRRAHSSSTVVSSYQTE